MTIIEPQDASQNKFHLSLHVTDIARSVDFYRALFGVVPAKQFDDYAKFEVEEPPLVFSITPHPPGPAGGVMSHAGLKVSSPEAIERVHQRLLHAGYSVQCQEGATCGYRRQSKIHVADPDGTSWEVYVVDEEVVPATLDRSVEGVAAALPVSTGPVVWEHYISNPPPDSIPHNDASVDEVRLVGTFNTNLSDAVKQRLVVEGRRVLKPGGKILVHGLMADRPFPGAQPSLPGLAAMVAHVPVHSQPLELLRNAGFVGIHITRYSDKPWLRHDGVELREVKLIAWQPESASTTRRVLYKGPFVEAVDESGNVFPRGKRVEVSDTVWNQLRRGAAAEQFLFLDLPSASTGCS